MSNKTKTHIIETIIDHSINFRIVDNKVEIDPDKQIIFLRKIIVKPGRHLLSFKAISSYKNDITEVFENALTYLPNKVHNLIDDKQYKENPEITTTKKETPNNSDAENTNEPKENKNEGIDLDDENENINENSNDILTNSSFMIKTNRISISTPIEISKGQKSIEYVIKPEDIKESINYIEVRRIKIFINGKEYKAKNFVEFLKKIFPYINIELVI